MKGPHFEVVPCDDYEETHWKMVYHSSKGLRYRVFFTESQAGHYRIYPQGAANEGKIAFMLYHFYFDGIWPKVSRCGSTADLTYNRDP